MTGTHIQSPADLWELPHPLLTATVTESIESNFFARCPPGSRPHFLRQKISDTEAEQTVTSSEEPEKTATIDADPEKGSSSDEKKSSEKQKPKYDSSLAKALHKTFFVRWWTAGFLELCGGASNLPNHSRILNDIDLAARL